MRIMLQRLNSSCFLRKLSTASVSLCSQNTPVDLTFNRYDSKTDPCKPPIVILPGLFGHKGNWSSLAKAIHHKHHNEVVVLDMRNHGDAPWTLSMTYPEMAADVEHFIESNFTSDAIVIGHSMGGKIATLLALFRTDLVRKLVVEDVTPRPYGNSSLSHIPRYIDGMMNIAWDLCTIKSLTKARKFANERLKEVVDDQATRNFLLTSLKEDDGEVSWCINLEAVRENLPDIVSFPNTGDLTFTEPTLVIAGERSIYIKESDEPLFHQLFPKHKTITIPGAGHWVHSDKPNEFLAELGPFLED